MTRKEEFDLSIKQLLHLDEKCFGYVVQGNNKPFECYYSNTNENNVWESFINEMKNKYPTYYKSYSKGKGSELLEKKNNGKLNPPKMASVASSSRFIYLSLRDDYLKNLLIIEPQLNNDGKFDFEHKRKISLLGGTSPNLDAAYITKEISLYIEAKCHELFDSHKLVWRNSYFTDGVFYGNNEHSLQIDKSKYEKNHIIHNKELKEDIIDTENKELDLKVFELNENEPLLLDVKQFVCHLLGIACDNSSKRELVYLYFKPKALVGFENEYNTLEKQFAIFCNSSIISNFCKRNKITIKLYYAINNKMTDSLELEETLSFNNL